MSVDGLWIQSVAADGDLLTDSLRYDAVLRTHDRDSRILFGFSNSVPSALALTSAGAGLSGNLAVDGRLVVGDPGDVRYCLRVDSNAADRDLVMTRMLPDGTEESYINFRELKELLDVVGIVKPAAAQQPQTPPP
jgi:hypothetical protein